MQAYFSENTGMTPPAPTKLPTVRGELEQTEKLLEALGLELQGLLNTLEPLLRIEAPLPASTANVSTDSAHLADPGMTGLIARIRELNETLRSRCDLVHRTINRIAL